MLTLKESKDLIRKIPVIVISGDTSIVVSSQEWADQTE